MTRVSAVVVAAGRGHRAGAEQPKQYRRIGRETVLRLTLQTLVRHPGIGAVQAVIHIDDVGRFRQATMGLNLRQAVFGGETRQQSVLAGLEALEAEAPDLVLIHDAARPFVSDALISSVIDKARRSGAAVPALAVSDTVKAVDRSGHVMRTVDRSELRTVQTPQAFGFASLIEAHRRAAHAGRGDFSDDAAIMEWAGFPVSTVDGEAGNIKLTHPGDFMRAEAAHMATLGDVRIGSGIDVHAFGPGDHVTLGGISIPHRAGLIGHSDADVVLHALVDGVLGALADGDIGVHFPPSDPQWRGATSDRFVAFALERLQTRGGIISHIDINIVCEAPRITPHRDAMRLNIARLCGIDTGRIAVKATTSEKLGFTGRGEGIAAFVTTTVRLPWSAPDGRA